MFQMFPTLLEDKIYKSKKFSKLQKGKIERTSSWEYHNPKIILVEGRKKQDNQKTHEMVEMNPMISKYQ